MRSIDYSLCYNFSSSQQLESERSALSVTEPPVETDLVSQASGELMLSEPLTAMITGAAGLLGRAMDAQLSRSSWRVIALPRAALDITNEDDVKRAVELFRPDVLINCAATADV